MIEVQLLGGVDPVGANPATTTRARRRHPFMLPALVAASAPQAMRIAGLPRAKINRIDEAERRKR
jgi:hypothetical protein